MHEHVRVLSGYIRLKRQIYPLAERFGGYIRHPPGGYPRGGYIRQADGGSGVDPPPFQAWVQQVFYALSFEYSASMWGWETHLLVHPCELPCYELL